MLEGKADGTCTANIQYNPWHRFTGEGEVRSACSMRRCMCNGQLETNLDLMRGAEDRDTALGGIHREALVHATGASTITSRELAESIEQRAFQGWPEKGETGHETEKEEKGKETIKL